MWKGKLEHELLFVESVVGVIVRALTKTYPKKKILSCFVNILSLVHHRQAEATFGIKDKNVGMIRDDHDNGSNFRGLN